MIESINAGILILFPTNLHSDRNIWSLYKINLLQEHWKGPAIYIIYVRLFFQNTSTNWDKYTNRMAAAIETSSLARIIQICTVLMDAWCVAACYVRSICFHATREGRKPVTRAYCNCCCCCAAVVDVNSFLRDNHIFWKVMKERKRIYPQLF